MNKPKKYSPEVRERAVRMVFEHEAEHESQGAAMLSIARSSGARRKRCANGCVKLSVTKVAEPV